VNSDNLSCWYASTVACRDSISAPETIDDCCRLSANDSCHVEMVDARSGVRCGWCIETDVMVVDEEIDVDERVEREDMAIDN